MTEHQKSEVSLWEHAGFPGVPNAYKTPDLEEVDRVFKVRINELYRNSAPTVEQVESVLAWSVIRQDDFRAKLSFHYDNEILNQASLRDPGIAEELDYQEQLERIEQGVMAEAESMRARGDSPKTVDKFIKYSLPTRQQANARLRKPGLPGARETWVNQKPDSKARVAGAAWVVFVGALLGLGHLCGVLGPIGEFLTMGWWITVPSAVISWAIVSLLLSVYLFDPKVEMEGKWLIRDERTHWPITAWIFAVSGFVIALPFWASAIFVPAAATLPLLSGRVRRRVFESVGGVDGPALTPRELLGKEPTAGVNVFAPTTSTIRSQGAALPHTFPTMSRDGSMTGTLHATQEMVAELADHCSVNTSGLTTDVHRVTASLMLDVLVGATGADDLRLVGQYGSGPLRIAAKAVSIGMGQELLEAVDTPAGLKTGPAVADWHVTEAEAFRSFVDMHLERKDGDLALLTAAQAIEGTADLEFPALVTYRLETLTYALKVASLSS